MEKRYDHDILKEENGEELKVSKHADMVLDDYKIKDMGELKRAFIHSNNWHELGDEFKKNDLKKIKKAMLKPQKYLTPCGEIFYYNPVMNFTNRWIPAVTAEDDTAECIVNMDRLTNMVTISSYDMFGEVISELTVYAKESLLEQFFRKLERARWKESIEQPDAPSWEASFQRAGDEEPEERNSDRDYSDRLMILENAVRKILGDANCTVKFGMFD